jgi:electron transport complex protein RnfC
LPTEHGVLLLDGAAAFTVGRALLYNEPMLRVPLAVFDQARGVSHFVSAPVGMALRDMIEQLAIPPHGLDLRGGAALREVRLSGDCVAAGGELGIYAAPRQPDVNPSPCIRCAWCIEGCPVRINPAGLLEAAQRDDITLAREYGLDACIECGICVYVCPSYLPLLHGIRTLRGEEEIGPEDDEESSSTSVG